MDRPVVTTKDSAVSARVWISHSPTRDFREAQWEMKPVTLMNSTTDPKDLLSRQQYQFDLEKPSSGHLAIIAEVEFADSARRFWLSTIPYVLKAQ
jgi:hypothetical protein